MSWATCYSASNNIHLNFPAMMEDGRLYTSYVPESVLNKKIKQQENIQSNWQYRQFLQKNAESVIKLNHGEYCNDLGLVPHVYTNKTVSSNVPYSFRSTFDNTSPGYDYYTSDLKNPYMSREQLQARMISPYIHLPPGFRK
jgi:hypothetical protein